MIKKVSAIWNSHIQNLLFEKPFESNFLKSYNNKKNNEDTHADETRKLKKLKNKRLYICTNIYLHVK